MSWAPLNTLNIPFLHPRAVSGHVCEPRAHIQAANTAGSEITLISHLLGELLVPAKVLRQGLAADLGVITGAKLQSRKEKGGSE